MIMNTEVIGRMMEAKKYQMMAIKALFPEGKQEHIDNIEKELKAMFSESMMDCMAKCMSAASDIKAQAEEAGWKTDHTDFEAAGTGSAAAKHEQNRGTKKASGSAGVKKEKVHKVTID